MTLLNVELELEVVGETVVDDTLEAETLKAEEKTEFEELHPDMVVEV